MQKETNIWKQGKDKFFVFLVECCQCRGVPLNTVNLVCTRQSLFVTAWIEILVFISLCFLFWSFWSSAQHFYYWPLTRWLEIRVFKKGIRVKQHCLVLLAAKHWNKSLAMSKPQGFSLNYQVTTIALSQLSSSGVKDRLTNIYLNEWVFVSCIIA